MRLFVTLALLVCLLVACGAPAVEPEVVASPVAELPTPEPPTPTPPPTATAEPTETPTPAPLTASEIFARLSPSVAYITVPGSSGSGALIDGGYILTNAHVVWPHAAANITFPDGTTFDDVPLHARNALLDLALLGPVETDLTPIRFVDGESAAVGSEILLIGYPGERGRSPQPTLTEGLISRMREWEGGGITFFQTSSAVAGGQSGGIAVSPEGEAVGLSGLRFTEANYGLVASAADLMGPIEHLMVVTSSDDADASLTALLKRDDWTFSTIHDLRVYRVDEGGADVTITVEGDADAVVSVVNSAGLEQTYSDSGLYGEEKVSFRTSDDSIPMFVIIDYEQERTNGIPFKIRSNTGLTLVEDEDDGHILKVGETYTGTVDFPFDADVFTMALAKDQIVNLRVDSIAFDPVLFVDAKLGLDFMVSDDDSGGGLVEAASELTYRAPHGGTYLIAVYDFNGNAMGDGYLLSAQEVYEGAPTPMAPHPTPTPIASPLGSMRLYNVEEIPFTVEVPHHYVDDWRTGNCRDIVSPTLLRCLSDSSNRGVRIVLVVEDLQMRGLSDLTLDQAAAGVRELLASSSTGNVTVSKVQTIDGNEAAVVSTVLARDVRFTRMIVIDDERMAYNMTFHYLPDDKGLVDYIISTFRLK